MFEVRIKATENWLLKADWHISEFDWQLAIGHHVLREVLVDFIEFKLHEEGQLQVGLIHINLYPAILCGTIVGESSACLNCF